MSIRTTLCSVLILALSAPVMATKFHLGDKAEERATEGNAGARVIEGVIVKEDETSYTIRVVGGELTLLKSQVVRTDIDDLTVVDIEREEQAKMDQVAATETRRREVRAAEASARRDAASKAPKPGEPSERSILIEVDFQGLLPGYTFRTYDPVLHRANLSGLRQVLENYLRREVRKSAHR